MNQNRWFLYLLWCRVITEEVILCLEGQSGFNLSLQCSSCRRAPWSELQKRILLQFAQDKLHLLHLIKSCLFIFWFFGWLVGFSSLQSWGHFQHTDVFIFTPELDGTVHLVLLHTGTIPYLFPCHLRPISVCTSGTKEREFCGWILLGSRAAGKKQDRKRV